MEIRIDGNEGKLKFWIAMCWHRILSTAIADEAGSLVAGNSRVKAIEAKG